MTLEPQEKNIAEMDYLSALGESYSLIVEIDPSEALRTLREGLRMSDASREDVNRLLLNLGIEQ